jgi:hypothetical protein
MWCVRFRTALACVIVITAACAGPGGTAVATPPAAGSPTPGSTAASEPRLGSPSPGSGSTVLLDQTYPLLTTFNCLLPARVVGGADAGAVPGFLDMNTGHFVSDPTSEMTKVPNSWDDWRSVASPTLRGFTGITYSRSARRWIPAERAQVSPDGVHYAYPEVPTPNVNLRLHVVDLAAGTDTVISTGTNWGILDYRTEGIYVTKTRYYSGESNSGLWLMDPLDGSVRQVLPETATTLFMGGSAAWGSERPLLPTTLYRYDLTTGARTVWLTRPNRYVQFIGVDDLGNPLVSVSSTSGSSRELWVVSARSQGAVLYPASAAGGPLDGIPLLEPHGVWFGGAGGLWLLQPGGKLVHVSTAQVQPLGGCH